MIAKMHQPRGGRRVSDEYLALVREFPLRPIRSVAEHGRAMDIVGRLATHAEGSLTGGAQDYLDALTVLLEDFDRRQAPWTRISGRQLLQHLVAETEMSVAALGKIVGSASLASLILSGKREISKETMRRLGAHFHLDPGAFL